MSVNHDNLDNEELLHIGITAMMKNDHPTAISILKRSIEMHPEFPQAHYLLGAAYAQIGMFERAVTEMERSVQLDPKLDMARFQLGFLYLRSNMLEKSAE